MQVADRASLEAASDHLRSCAECDFIVADAHSLRQVAIKNASVQPETNVTHIGDDDSWRALQAARHHIPRAKGADGPLESELELISNVMGTFNVVLADASHPTVGGLKMRVGSRGGEFRYLGEAGSSMVNISGPLNESRAAQYSDAAAGAYSYTVLTPTEAGNPIVAVHLHQGKFGFVYIPLEHDRPLTITGLDHAALVEYVKTQYGVVLDGLRIGDSSFGTPN